MFEINFENILLDKKFLCNTCCNWFDNFPTCCNKCYMKYCSKDCFYESCLNCPQCNKLFHRCDINSLEEKCYKCLVEN